MLLAFVASDETTNAHEKPERGGALHNYFAQSRQNTMPTMPISPIRNSGLPD